MRNHQFYFIAPKGTTDDQLQYYFYRWIQYYNKRSDKSIEVWHKILKSGCRIESRQLATADRLKRCLALYSVIAWRILYATMLARALPDASWATAISAGVP